MKDFDKQELYSVGSLLRSQEFKVFMAWLASGLADTHLRIYAATTDREAQVLIGGAREVATIIDNIEKAPQRLESERLPTAPATIF